MQVVPIPEGVRWEEINSITMDTNGTGMTISDVLALRHDNPYCYGGFPMGGYGAYPYYHKRNGAATTAIGLSAGLGGAALLGVIMAAWANNSASKARSRAAEKLSDANARTAELLAQNNAKDITALTNALLAERNSREDWQRRNQPTIGQYVDVQTNPNLSSTLMDYIRTEANAQAQATAMANNPLNAAIGTDSFLKVQRYSAPKPCGCDGGCNGGY